MSEEKVKLKQEEQGISLDSYLQEPLWKGMLKVKVMNSTRNENMPKLPGPPIFTTMTTTSGAKIHLVGTFHGTKKSREDVSNVIRHTKPNVVFVELCELHGEHLVLHENIILSGLTFNFQLEISKKEGPLHFWKQARLAKKIGQI